jgi:hypothetical protein
VAVVGEAYVVVRAITNQVRDDIRRGFDGAGDEGRRAGQEAGKGYQDGFSRQSQRSSGMFANLRREALQAAASFQSLVRTGYALGPALAGLVGIIGGAVSGLFALGAQAAAAVPALFALVNAMTALAQAGLVLKTIFSGVGSAISAGLSGGSGGGGGGGIDLSRQIEEAKERIEDARKGIARAYQENAEALKRANQQITDAIEAEAEAYDNLEDAERNVQKAEEDLAKAQQEVNEAREEAREQIQQLRFELEESVLSEERAAIGLEKAREAFARASSLPPNNRARREAELEFKEAELRYRRAKDRTSDLTKDEQEATEKGIEGSDIVIAAKEREEQAEENLAEAKKGVVQAEKDLADASRAVTEAYANYNATLAENKTRLEDARDALQDAKDALEDLKKSAGGGGGGGVDPFAEALKKLSPAAREFVFIMIDLVKQFDAIKKAAQEEFFGRINDDVKELAQIYLPILEEKIPKTAGILGEVAEGIAEVFKDPENVDRFTAIWDSNDKIIRQLGKALANLAEIFLILLENAAPVAERFAKWVNTLTKTWRETANAKDKTGELADMFSYAGDVAATLGEIFGNIGSAIFNIGKAAAGPGSGGEMLLNMLRDVTAGWEKFTGSEEGQARLTKFFQNIVPLVSELGGLIGDVFREMFETTEAGVGGEDGGPLAVFVRSLREVVEVLGGMGPDLLSVLPTIGEGLVSAAEAIANLAASGAIQTFFDVLAQFADVVADVTSSPLFQQIYSAVAPVFALSSALGLVFSFLKFIFLGAILGPIIKFTGLFTTLFGVVGKIAGVMKIVLFNFKMLGFALGIGTGPLALIIAGIAALIALFIGMWNNSEKLRTALKELFEKVVAKAVEVFNNLREKVEAALEPLGGFEGAMETINSVLGFFGDIVAGTIVPLLEYSLMNAFAIIEAVLGTIIDLIGNLIGAFAKIWEGISTGDIGMIFEGIVDAITAPFRALWPNLQKLFTDVFNNIINLVKSLLGISSPSQVFIDIATAILDAMIQVLTFMPRKILELFIKMWTGVSDFFTNTVMPFVTDLPSKFTDWLMGVWDAVYDFLNEIWNKALDFLGVSGPAATLLKDLPKKFKDWMKGLWNGVSDYLNDSWNKAVSFVGGVIKLYVFDLPLKFAGWLKGLWDSVIKLLNGPDGVWSKVRSFFGSTVPEYLGTIPGKISEKLSGMWDGILSALKAAWGVVQSWWNSNVAGSRTLDPPDWIPFVPDNVTITIPRLARGGVIPATRGGMLAVVGEGGRSERVEPLDRNGLSNRDKAMIDYLTGGSVGGGTTINVYPAPGMDERELAQKVSRELAFMMRRGSV